MGTYKALDGLNKEQVNAMSYEELIDTHNAMGREKHERELRQALLNILDVIDAGSSSIIES